MSIPQNVMDELLELTDSKADIKAALRTKNRDPSDDMRTYGDEIRQIETAQLILPERKDINFYDYDGILMYSYTFLETGRLDALPEPPAHDGLIFQEWNWTLDEIRTATIPADIMATFDTIGGWTEIHLSLVSTLALTPEILWRQTVAHGVDVDWGDGSPIQTYAGSGNTNIIKNHTYETIGDYVIKLRANSGTFFLGVGTNSGIIRLPYSKFVTAIHIGSGGALLNNYGLYGHASGLISLRRVTIPNTITTIGTGFLMDATALENIGLPRGITAIPANGFSKCSALRLVSIPYTVTEIKNNAFEGCNNLFTLSLPNSISIIGAHAFNGMRNLDTLHIKIDSDNKLNTYTFYSCSTLKKSLLEEGITSIAAISYTNCTSILEFDIPSTVTYIGDRALANFTTLLAMNCKPVVPPTCFDDSTVFRSLNSSCIIYVPTGSLSAYQNAPIWSEHASKMQEKDF